MINTNSIKDSRINTIMLNINLPKCTTNSIAKNYESTVNNINNSQKKYCITYKNLRQTIKESYLIGSTKYGNNFIM